MFQTFVHRFIYRPLPIAPLVTFRILFGGLMMIGALRFMQKGWIERLYGEPRFFFKYYGFEWVQTLDVPGIYAVYSLIALSAAGIMLGFVYRWSVLLFFLSFSYAELTDAANYLNHYYLVILLAFLLFFIPANRRFSLDTRLRPSLALTHVPAWTICLLQFQLGVVYFFAGFAKLNPDWLFRAMPLAVWLPEKAGIPVIGPLLALPAAAIVFSWFGAIYDLTIPFWLSIKKTRIWAYGAVVVFHVLTKLLFNIGLFPFIMIFNTLIFFPANTHHRWLKWIGYHPGEPNITEPTTYNLQPTTTPILLALYIAIQVLIPLRFLCYPGNVLWTEEGYRFAWRVMLVEKNGYATFYVSDPATGRRTEVINSRFLTPFQEKQMAIQPDFILQYAHFLARHYREREGIKQPVVTVDSYVALNGRPSERFIDPDVNLADELDGLGAKEWVLRY